MKWPTFLTTNALKIIAAIAMVFDHVGFIFFPSQPIFRIIGRLAFPIFAFMIAEGCLHTRNRLKHLIILAGSALILQIGYYIFLGSVDFSIFVIFTIAVLFIYLFDLIYTFYENKKYAIFILLMVAFAGLIVGMFFLCGRVYDAKHIYYNGILSKYVVMNYGFTGMVLPLFIYIIKKTTNLNIIAVAVCGIVLVGKCLCSVLLSGGLNCNWYLLLALIPLLFYNGQRGKWKLKYFFYIFYPAHLIILYLIRYPEFITNFFK